MVSYYEALSTLQYSTDQSRNGGHKKRKFSNEKGSSVRGSRASMGSMAQVPSTTSASTSTTTTNSLPPQRLGPTDPLPGPYFNLFSADDDDDTEYEPTDESDDEDEVEDEGEVDPEEWILDPDQDFALPQGYVLPPYLDSLPPELQMFAPEPQPGPPPPVPKQQQLPQQGYTHAVPVTDIQYRVNPYHYTPSKPTMKELLSQRRDELDMLKRNVSDSSALRQLQHDYFHSVRQRELEMTTQTQTQTNTTQTRRKPHNAGTTTLDNGVELRCEHCGRVFRGARASTHRQQHVKRLHPDKYVKLKG